jgi:hypothetical protein
MSAHSYYLQRLDKVGAVAPARLLCLVCLLGLLCLPACLPWTLIGSCQWLTFILLPALPPAPPAALQVGGLEPYVLHMPSPELYLCAAC